MKQENNLVSIIMNCHNGEKYLNESLKSIFNQSYKNWELIFYDNCSDDKSFEILNKYKKDKRVKYFKSNKFLSLYGARNKAIEKATGEYVTFLDTDDLWVEDKLEKQINFLKDNNNFEIAYSNYKVLDEKKKIESLKYNKLLPSGKITNDLLKRYTIGILTVIIKKKLFEIIKFKDEYNIIGDFDFFIKLSEKCEIGCIQQPLSIYRYHDQSLSKKQIKLNILELENWLKNDRKKLSDNYSLLNLKFFIFKLRLKYYLMVIGKLFRF